MIDRVGSFSATQGRMVREDRSAERPGSAGEFEAAMIGAAGAGQNGAAPSPLRLRRFGARVRETSAPVGGAASGAAPDAPAASPRVRASGGRESAAVASSSEPPGGSATAATEGTASGTQFVRSTSANAPHLVRFADVPESARQPQGPYHQAPPEFGGEWWFVNPFTGPEPWRSLEGANRPPKVALETEPAPADFVKLFGQRPDTRTAATQWEQDLSYFQGTGLPEGFDNAQLEAATEQFEAWGLGEPVFYEGRYGWQVRFPDSQLPMFETTASTALLVPHLVIAEYQARAIQEGERPAQYHPWLPDRLRSA